MGYCTFQYISSLFVKLYLLHGVAQLNVQWFIIASCSSPAIALGSIGRNIDPNGGPKRRKHITMSHGRQQWAIIEQRTNVLTVDNTGELQKTRITRMTVAQMSMPIAHHIRHIIRKYCTIIYSILPRLPFSHYAPQPQYCKLLLAFPALQMVLEWL